MSFKDISIISSDGLFWQRTTAILEDGIMRNISMKFNFLNLNQWLRRCH